MSVLYPVAANAEEALNAPLGRAAREREAVGVAGQDVRFVTEDIGPAYDTQAAALGAHAEALASSDPQDRYCALGERLAPSKGRTPLITPVKPVFRDGRRWPAPSGSAPRTIWRLSISYWKLVTAAAEEEHQEDSVSGQARTARRDPSAEGLDARQLRGLARQPLQAVKPQQPLDIGLFEVRAPENPQLVLPDE
jgi:hypothetical protein